MVCYNLRSTINLHNCNLKTKKNTTAVKNKTFTLMLIEKTEKNYILNNDLTLYKMVDMSINASVQAQLTFDNIKDFNGDFTLGLNIEYIYVSFFDTNFDFYNQYDGKLIATCQEYKKSIENLTKNFIFNSLPRIGITVNFYKSQFKICSLLF